MTPLRCAVVDLTEIVLPLIACGFAILAVEVAKGAAAPGESAVGGAEAAPRARSHPCENYNRCTTTTTRGYEENGTLQGRLRRPTEAARHDLPFRGAPFRRRLPGVAPQDAGTRTLLVIAGSSPLVVGIVHGVLFGVIGSKLGVVFGFGIFGILLLFLSSPVE